MYFLKSVRTSRITSRATLHHRWPPPIERVIGAQLTISLLLPKMDSLQAIVHSISTLEAPKDQFANLLPFILKFPEDDLINRKWTRSGLTKIILINNLICRRTERETAVEEIVF